MVDFNINLVKSMTSTPEERIRFYHRMLIYLVACAALMVGVAYLSSTNIVSAMKTNRERMELVEAVSSVSEYGKAFYADPGRALDEFSHYATDLEVLRSALEERSQFLPVMSQLFSDFPDNVALQSLNANAAEKSIEFILVAPVIDAEGNDVLRPLQARWRDNKELRTRANAVTQLTSEREMVGDTLMVYVKYKCIVK